MEDLTRELHPAVALPEAWRGCDGHAIGALRVDSGEGGRLGAGLAGLSQVLVGEGELVVQSLILGLRIGMDVDGSRVGGRLCYGRFNHLQDGGVMALTLGGEVVEKVRRVIPELRGGC